MMWWKKKKDATVLSALEGYNCWASTYHQESNPIKNLSDTLVEEFLPDLRGRSVFDAGCGTGKFCTMAAQRGASKILGIDLSQAMIEVAKKQCPSSEFRCGNLSDVSLEGEKYSVIICALVLGHIEQLSPALDNLLKTLDKNGTLIITDFHPYLSLLKSKRTFRDQQTGLYFEIRHYLHLFEKYIDAFNQHGVILEQLKEPVHNNTPVVFGMQARKI